VRLLFSDHHNIGGARCLQHLAVMVQAPHFCATDLAILDEPANSAAAPVAHTCETMQKWVNVHVYMTFLASVGKQFQNLSAGSSDAPKDRKQLRYDDRLID